MVADKLTAYPAAPAAILGKLGIPCVAPAAPPPCNRGQAAARADLLELFFAASSDERRLILTNLDVDGRTGAAPAGGRRAK